MKKKKKIIILLIAIILGTISYVYFLDGYYSIDTEWIYTRGIFDYATKDAYIRDGRFFSAIIFILFSFMNLSIKKIYIINLLASILISSISVVKIYKIINKYKNLEKTYLKIIAFMISYIFIFNFTQINIMLFIDSAIINASILFLINSLEKTIIEEKKKQGLLYALIAIFCYQGTISVYIATTFLICLLKYKKINKTFFKKLITPIITIILACIINLIAIIIIPYVTKLDFTKRLTTDGIMIKFLYNLQNFYHIIFDCQNYFPKYLWLIICFLILVITLIYGLKTKKESIPINLIILFAVYVLSSMIILPLVSIDDRIEIGRAFMPIGETIAGTLIYIICNTDILENKKIYKNIMIIIISFYFLLNIFNTIKLTREHKIANKIDESFAKQVEKEVKKIEGEDIKDFKYTMYYIIDENATEKNKYNTIIFRILLLLKCMYTEAMMEFYIGNGIKPNKLMYDEKIIKENFETQTNKELQIKKIDEVYYIVVHV